MSKCTLSRTLVLATALVSLSGCQSFPLTSWMSKRSDLSSLQIAPTNGAASLAEGRSALQAGKPVAAIAPLRAALLDPSTRASASNALGVAYAQLGREDLAEQFFKSAIVADPNDERFVANLLRLQHTILTRKAQSEAARLAARQDGEAQLPAGFVTETSQSPDQAPRSAAKVERRSRGEVFIASAPAQAAPTATVAYLGGQNGNKTVAPAGAAEPSRPAVPVAPQARLVDNPFGGKPAMPSASPDRP